MKYTLPASRTQDTSPEEPMDDYERKLNIPVSDEILKATPVGTKVKVTLEGEVCGAEDDKSYDGAHIRVYVSTVDVKESGSNEFAELADED